MFSAFQKAFLQSSDPAFIRVFFKATWLALAAFVAFWTIVGLALVDLLPRLLGLLPWGIGDGIAGNFAVFTGLLGTMFLSLIFFPAIMVTVMAFFLDDIVIAVERQHYPNRARGRKQPFLGMLMNTVAFLGTTILFNALLLPFYFIPVINLIVYYLLNGYLFGREYFELVALRRMSLPQMRFFRKQRHSDLIGVGVCCAFLLTIPLVNLFVPIWMTAVMLHRYEEWVAKGLIREEA